MTYEEQSIMECVSKQKQYSNHKRKVDPIYCTLSCGGLEGPLCRQPKSTYIYIESYVLSPISILFQSKVGILSLMYCHPSQYYSNQKWVQLQSSYGTFAQLMFKDEPLQSSITFVV